MVKTKLSLTHLCYRSIQRQFLRSYPLQNPHHRYMFVNSNYTFTYFLNLIYCIETNNCNYDPGRKIFLPPHQQRPHIEDYRSNIILLEYTQHVEIQLVEMIHGSNFNHEL